MPSGRSGWQYTIPGVVFDILGALMLIGVVLQVGLMIMVIAQGQVGDNLPMVLGRMFGTIAISGPIGVVYIMGGSAMVRRRGLGIAKAAAVIGCIPCFNCVGILTPIGIWACVLVFSQKATLDFSE